MSRSREPLETLRNARLAPRLIEDYRPLAESLEWRLSEMYWNTAGIHGFVQSEIPYTITSSGTLSANAARLLYANCLEHPPHGRMEVLEIGSGTALFARLFLDEFCRLCTHGKVSFHEQITYYVTDRSPRSQAQWKEFGLLEGYPAVPALADGFDPLSIETAEGGTRITGLRAVFCNYSLDSLPASVLRKGENGVEELCVRTHLSSDSERVRQLTSLALDGIRDLATKADPALIPLVGVLEFEAAFLPSSREYPHQAEALSFAHDWPRVILNHGAIECLEKALAGLDPSGFVLLNDYGLVRSEDAASMSATQRFGSSAALGLNFPFLEHHFSSSGFRVLRPDLDEQAPLHARLVTRGRIPETSRCFHEIFDWPVQKLLLEPQEQARQHISTGRMESAKQAYETALSSRPNDWVLLGEIAEYLVRNVADYQAGLEIASAALALNPWYSVWLWNVYGDALYALDRFQEAHQAYRKAEAIEPEDVRTNLNLAYSHSQLGNDVAALQSIGKALAKDRGGLFRERLLEKQQQILVAARAQETAEQEWMARRAARLASC